MNKSTPLAWTLSIGLHGLVALFAIFTWKPSPLTDTSPSISVDIIAATASAIGPDAEIEKPTETNQEQAQISEEDPTSEPLDTPYAEPPPMPIAPPNPAPVAKSQPVPKTNTPPPIAPKGQQAIAKPTPARPEPNKQSTQKAALPSPTKSGDASPLFDLAAATKAASGVNSGGRAQPKLTNSRETSSGARSGGGSKLQGDLASALRNQVKDCWHEPADLSDPARLIVELQMELAADGNFIRSRLVRPATKAGADGALLVAIDNAQRAARQCAPYDLPSERYDEWRSFTFRFDPRELRR